MRPQPSSVLFVDPFTDEREMYTDYLRARGFDVRAFVDPVRAYHDAVQAVPDAMLVRLRQDHPELNGIEIARRVKTHDATRRVPVIIISTSILVDDEHAARAAGCDSYLLLPCSPKRLAAEVRRAIQRCALRSGPARAKHSVKASLRSTSRPPQLSHKRRRN